MKLWSWLKKYLPKEPHICKDDVVCCGKSTNGPFCFNHRHWISCDGCGKGYYDIVYEDECRGNR